jgi:hypothetical protein
VLTRGLIDAASTLPPAERALLDLWVNRGLDDERLAAMSGVTSDAIEARRARIVQRLSEQLSMTPVEVGEALAGLAATSAARQAGRTDPHGNGEPPSITTGRPDPSGARRRRRRWAVIGALLMLVVVRAARSGRTARRCG